MLQILTTTQQTVTLPLALDPAVQAANPDREDGGQAVSPLALYALTSDPDHLTVPDGAWTCTVRPLSASESRAATAAAGRVVYADIRAWETVARAAMELEAGGAEFSVAWAEALDAQPGEIYDGCRRESARRLRVSIETVRLGCVEVHLPGQAFTGPDLAASVLAAGTPLGESLVVEVARHVQMVGTSLPKAPRPSSVPTSGGALTCSPGSGSATAATGGYRER